MSRLNRLILSWSRSWWLLLGVVLLFVLSFQSLFIIGDWFAAITAGYQPFDLQNPLSVAAVLAQLPSYTSQSRAIYGLFVVADTIFPALGVLPSALVLARSLEALGITRTRPALASRLVLVVLLPAPLDWLENACYVAAIGLYPGDVTLWATLGVTLKATKIGLGLACNLAILPISMYAVWRWAVPRLQQR